MADAARKRCSICKREQSTTDFHRRSASHDGLQPFCRKCARERSRRYRERYSAKNTARNPREATPITYCRSCGESKASVDFALTRSASNGLHDICSSCDSARHRAHYEVNRTQVLAANARWRVENRERCRAASRQYYEQNKERIAQQQRAYYEANRERIVAYVNAWQRANPERMREYEHRRKALLRGAVLAPDAIAGRVAVWRGRCWMCGAEDAPELDHVKPISKGGAHILANLRPACKPCNSRKSNRWPLSEVIANG